METRQALGEGVRSDLEGQAEAADGGAPEAVDTDQDLPGGGTGGADADPPLGNTTATGSRASQSPRAPWSPRNGDNSEDHRSRERSPPREKDHDCPRDGAPAKASARSQRRERNYHGPRRDRDRSRDKSGKHGSNSPDEEGLTPSWMMVFLLSLVGMLEGIDTQLLPVSMYALQRDIGFQLQNFAYLSVAQGVSINIAAPLWGILADRGVLRRRTILIIGSLGQGVVTIALAGSRSLWTMIALRAIVGGLLAAFRPISNAFIADMTATWHRGKVFGSLQSAHLVGATLSTIIAGNLSRKEVLGLQGWRVTFGAFGVLAMVVAILLVCKLQEPVRRVRDDGTTEAPRLSRSLSSTRDWGAVVVEEVQDLCRFLTLPTFCVMVIQGIFGTIPWIIMGNMMLYFQLSGLDDGQASLLAGEQPVCAAMGNLLGGWIADSLARRLGKHGRPLSAQITVFIGIPLNWFIFASPGAGFGVYFTLIAAFGLLGSWAQSGTNLPILTEIVPDGSRSRVMAWETALENSIASLAGQPMVTLLATKVFGYEFDQNQVADGKDLQAATALGRAMQAAICVPWCLTLAAYTVLHWSYPRDLRQRELSEMRKRRARELAEKKAGLTRHFAAPNRY